jgi:methionine sulfoxide reductase heme-binding subunit
MTDPSQYLFWITSRAAGTSAMVLASASVAVGLTMGSKLRIGTGPDRFNLHQTLSLAALVAIAVHGVALLGDSYLKASALDLTVPFAFSYKTIPTSVGIIAAWTLAILGLSYYLRRQIGYRRWKLIHRFAAVAWAGALIHSFTEGTDAGQLWFVGLIVLTALPAFGLLVARLATRRAGSRGSRRAPAPVDERSAGSVAPTALGRRSGRGRPRPSSLLLDPLDGAG